MAIRERVEFVDDLDGTVCDGDGVSIAFSLDGHDYEIDLSAGNADAMRHALAPFVDAARRAHDPGRVGPSPFGRPPVRSDEAEIRRWARRQGYTISDHGRVPTKLIADYDRFQARHGSGPVS